MSQSSAESLDDENRVEGATVTHARVKLRGSFDNQITVVEVKNIAEFQKKLPKDIYDFDHKKLYTIFITDKDSCDIETKVPGQICNLACGSKDVEELQKKRPHFPALTLSVLEDYAEGTKSVDVINNPASIESNEGKSSQMITKNGDGNSNLESDLDARINTLLHGANEGTTLKNVKVMVQDSYKLVETYEKKIKILEHTITKKNSEIEILTANLRTEKNTVHELNVKLKVIEEINMKILDKIGTYNVSKLPVQRKIFSASKENQNYSNEKKPDNDADSASDIFYQSTPKKHQVSYDKDYVAEQLDLNNYEKNFSNFSPSNLSPIESGNQATPQSTDKNVEEVMRDPVNLEQKTNLPENLNTTEFTNKRKKKNKKEKKTSKKDKHKKKKSNDSEDEYDSDNYNDSNEHLPLTKYDRVTESGQKEKMFHLYYGISIPWQAYKDVRDVTKPPLVLKKTARAIWGKNHLMNRAINVSKTKCSLPGRSPRKSLTPRKKAALRKYYYKQIDDIIKDKKKRIELKGKWKVELGDYINSLIKAEKAANKNKDNSSSSSEESSTESHSSN